MSEQTSLSEQAQIAQQVLQDILREMTLTFPVELGVTETADIIILTMTSPEPLGLLIGKGGQTLNALELVVRSIVQRKIREYGKRIVIDAEGYRLRQEERLQNTARDMARRVLETDECVALEPMNARDRRMVHTAVSEVEGLETISLGEDPYRYIVICPAGKRPPEMEEEA